MAQDAKHVYSEEFMWPQSSGYGKNSWGLGNPQPLSPTPKGAGEGPTTVRQTARFPRNIQSLPMGNHAKNQDFLYSQKNHPSERGKEGKKEGKI